MNRESAESTPQLTCTILGSFRFIDQINLARAQLSTVGISVLAPGPGNVVKEINGFKILDTDNDKSPDEIERNFLECLFNSHFALIVDPEGYIGFNTAKEMGLAQSIGIPIIATEPLDPNLDDTPTWPLARSQVYVRKTEDMVNFLRDPISKISRTIPYENARIQRQPKIKEAVNKAMSHARMVNLDFNSLGPGWWVINNGGIPEQIDVIERLNNEYAKTNQPVKIYIAGYGVTITYTPERGFQELESIQLPEYIDPPGIQTLGYIELGGED